MFLFVYFFFPDPAEPVVDYTSDTHKNTLIWVPLDTNY